MKTNANVVPEGGVITVDMTFDRIKYMLDRLLPVAEKFKVQMGNHPADPATHVGYRGITRWDSPDVFAGFVELDEKGFVLTGPDLPRRKVAWPLERDPLMFETSVPGVFAAGDVRSGANRRIAMAVGEGSAAIHSVHRYLQTV